VPPLAEAGVAPDAGAVAGSGACGVEVLLAAGVAEAEGEVSCLLGGVTGGDDASAASLASALVTAS